MRPVIYNGVQYDADKLPKHVPADEIVPADEWFAQNRKSGGSRPAATTPTEVPDTGTAPVPNDTETPGPVVEKAAAPKTSKRRGR